MDPHWTDSQLARASESEQRHGGGGHPRGAYPATMRMAKRGAPPTPDRELRALLRAAAEQG